MGLCLSVGFLTELAENDPEGFDTTRAQFDAVNQALADAGLPPYDEPSHIDEADQISYDMFGYSGLHYLRRIAAHLTYAKSLPLPGDKNSAHDPLLGKYYEEFCRPSSGGGFLGLFKFKKSRQIVEFEFGHLINHSDCEGFYLPVDFLEVIVSNPELKIPGQVIGSSYQLLQECEKLAKALAIPEAIDPEGSELWEAASSQGTGEGWKRYGVESFICVRLMHACQASIRSGAAVVFC